MNISYRQLDHWCKEGYLLPEGGEDGTQRSWPEIEIKVGRMMSHLVAIGMTPGKAAVYARAAVVDRKKMLLEFRDGRLRARGPFADSVREGLERGREIRDGRKYRGANDNEKTA
jgi:hypothetical protein